jgi:hypothetical protein
MKTYYFTFGQRHPLRDNWIEIIAPDGQIARDETIARFGLRWAMQYNDADWRPEYFSGGRVGRVLEVS